MNISNLKYEKCAKCGGMQAGFGLERTVFYLSDEIKVRCNNCGDIQAFAKSSAGNKLVPSPAPQVSPGKVDVRGGTRSSVR